jgi:hypothetical protein
MLPSYPKVFSIGSEYVPNIFEGNVEVTEKIDGSMFCMGCSSDNQIVMRSKSKELFLESYEKMFELAVNYVIDHQELLLKYPGIYFYGEFLNKPKHNVLFYDRVPKNNIILFGVFKEGSGFYKEYQELQEWAERLELEPVPLLYYGEVKSKDELLNFLELESILGGSKVEGVVVKNYNQTTMIRQRIVPQFGKFVREEFKETLNKTWVSDKDKVQVFIDSFRTEARWLKAIQHLKEQGLLSNEPKDIGILLNEIKQDLIEEEELNIKEGLYKLFKDQILRKVISGFPEFYKDLLLNNAFNNGN